MSQVCKSTKTTALLATLVWWCALAVPCNTLWAQGSQDSISSDATAQPANADDVATAPAEPELGRGINFLSLLTRGGWFMIPLFALSVIVVAISVERFLSLRREKVFPRELVDRLSALSQSPGGLDPREAYQACQENPSAAAHVMRSMLVKVGRPQSEIENAVAESSQRQATRLLQMGSWLSLAAAIAPLIGLLGTVWGITQAFYDTTQLVTGQNRAEALAEGIYTALVTTMCGLLIAIPAAVLAHFFENRILRVMNDIEEMIFNLMPQLERYEGQLRFTIGDPAPVTSPSPSARESARQGSESGTGARREAEAAGQSGQLGFPEPEPAQRKPQRERQS